MAVAVLICYFLSQQHNGLISGFERGAALKDCAKIMTNILDEESACGVINFVQSH